MAGSLHGVARSVNEIFLMYVMVTDRFSETARLIAAASNRLAPPGGSHVGYSLYIGSQRRAAQAAGMRIFIPIV